MKQALKEEEWKEPELTPEDEVEVQKKLAMFEGFVTRKGAIQMLMFDKKNEEYKRLKEQKKPVFELKKSIPEPSDSHITGLIEEELEKTNQKASDDTIKDIESIHPKG